MSRASDVRRLRAGVLRPLAVHCLAAVVLFSIPRAAGQTAGADPAALSDQAQQHAMEKRFAEAEKLWREAIAISPDFFPARFNLGFMFTTMKEYGKALPELEHATRLYPDDFNASYLLGLTLLRLDRAEDALRQWQTTIKIKPHLLLMQAMAVEYGRGRYFQAAAEISARALELSPADPNAHFVAIKAYQDARDYESAMKLAKNAVDKFPDSARANFEYAFHLQKIGQLEESMGFLTKAMEIDPSYEEPPFFYGDLLVKQGRYEDAVQPLRKAVENRPDYIAARVTLGRALMALKKWADAIKELEAAMRFEPKHPQPHLLLSQIHFRMGDRDRAKKEKDISLRLRRQNPAFLEAQQSRPFPESR